MQWNDKQSAFKNRVKCGQILNNKNIIDPLIFLNECKLVLVSKIGQFMFEFKSPVKINCGLYCEYVIKKGDQEILSTIYHVSKMKHISISDNFNEWFIENVYNSIKNKLDEFQERDSGKALKRIFYLDINIAKYNNTHYSASSFITLPKQIQNKHAVINIQNGDEKCFIWSILAGLLPAKNHPTRPSSYPQNHNEIFNLKNIDFPTPLSQISIFEKQNNISINVYGLEFDVFKKEYEIVGPLHLTNNKKNVHINLLYFTKDSISHFAFIKSLSRLVSSQLSKSGHKKWICERCLQYFARQDILLRHEEDCKLMGAVKINMPSCENNILKFKNFQNKLIHPFVIYADFESLTIPIQTCQPDSETSYRNPYQYHLPCAIGYHVVCSYDESLSWYESYTGPDCVKWFLYRLDNIVNVIDSLFKNKKLINMNDSDWINYDNAKICHICEEKFEDLENKRKVRDHCHLSGKFRGAAHLDCNLNFQIPKFIPIFFHNLTGYDGHLLVKEFAIDENDITIIPINEEKYITFTKQIGNMKVRFLDSYKFLNSSLDKLSKSLNSDAFKYLRKHYVDKEEYSLLMQKGIYPYDYMNSWERLQEKHLPSKEKFYSRLKDENISDKEYTHANKVWNKFKHNSLQDYMETYLKTDILLLTDIFENFRTTCLNAYALDPVYYYTTPGLAWDAMLKITRINLELLTDIDMLLFFERGIRGGISQTCNRYACANNQYMAHYNPEEEEKYLIYFDACNLYGWAMKNYLPFGGFEWLEPLEIEKIDILTIPEDNILGYVFEVDLEYPHKLHDRHKDLPLCCEHSLPPGSKLPKLMTTLYDKTKYIIHYRNLQQALNLGLKLKKIHRAIKFNQSQWLSAYIDINTTFRKKAVNDFDKNFFKLMNNAIFGKSIENIRNRRDIKLVNKWNGCGGARKLIAKFNFHKISIFNENLAAIELKKTKLLFNKPIYIGMCILDISKLLMYEFHYNYIHKNYVSPKLLYMDTDSFIYELKNLNPYELIKRDIHRFDTSDFEHNNIYGIPKANKKVVGLFKDENGGKIINEFVGLRAKMYNFVLENDNENHARAKGISGTVVRTLTIDDYKNVLFNKNFNLHKKQCNIKSVKHSLFTMEENKLSLSADDDKRFLLPNSHDTLPWGHHRLRNVYCI